MTGRNVKLPWSLMGQWLGLSTIALFAFNAISTLLFAVLGLAPSSQYWTDVWMLAAGFAIAGATVGLQTLKLSQRIRWLAGIVGGATAGAILGFHNVGLLSWREPQWSIGCGVADSLLFGGIGAWAYGWAGRERWFFRLAIAIVGVLCAYAAAFGFGVWMFAALSVGRWGLAFFMGGLMGLYLWLTRRSLRWIYRQWRWGFARG